MFSLFPCSSSSDPIPDPDTMTVASKEQLSKLGQLQSDSVDATKSAASNDDTVFSVAYSALKKVAVVGAIYFVGYMGWSMAWLITPIIFSVTRDQWKKAAQLKRDVSILSAISNERDVIFRTFSKISDLPAWVNYFPEQLSRHRIDPLVVVVFFSKVYFPDVERCEWLNRVMSLPKFVSEI